MDPELHTQSSSPRGEEALRGLERDGLLRREQAVLRTTKRWQAAMARAALRLYRAGEDSDDLRIPIAAALFELYGPDVMRERMAELVEAMLPIEAAELDPRPHVAREPRGALLTRVRTPAPPRR